MGSHIPVLAIVGYSNSGKTTLMEKLISKLSAQGLNVCSIKHSHHQPEMDTPGKDSWRHKQAGASGSLLVGPEQMLMVKNVSQVQTPQQLADTYFPDADLVLVEGYASMPCPKIEVVRKARSTDLRCHTDELIAVATDMPDLDVDVPKLNLNDVDEGANFILSWLGSYRHSPDRGNDGFIENCTAVILAGGLSKRMGKDKASVLFQGKTLLQHAEDNLKPLFADVFVSVRERRNDSNLQQVLDDNEDRAPMLGIAANLEAITTDWLFVLGVDMPLLSVDLVRFMAEQRGAHQAVAVFKDDMPQPLCCFYHKDCLSQIQRNIKAGKRSLKHLLQALDTQFVSEKQATLYDAGLKSFISLDTTQDLEKWSA